MNEPDVDFWDFFIKFVIYLCLNGDK